MFKYVLEPNAGDSHQSSPYWLALVVRFAVRDSYDRGTYARNRREVNRNKVDVSGLTLDLDLQETANLRLSEPSLGAPSFKLPEMKLPEIEKDGSVSREEVRDNPVAEAASLLLGSQIREWSVSQGKGAAQGVATMSLDATYDYRRIIAAGDWVLFWAFDNQADYHRVKQNLMASPKKRSNSFMDGLKFVGRIQGVRRRLRRNPSSGAPVVNYALTAVSFKEFNYTIYYHPSMQAKYGKNTVQWMVDFGGEINQFLLGDGGNVQAGNAINKLLRVCMGMGPGAAWTNGINPNSIGPNSPPPPPLQPSPNGRVLVPATVTEVLLGETAARQTQARTYVDILKSWIGIQSYGETGRSRRRFLNELLTDTMSQPGRGFAPTDMDGKLSGEFLPRPIDFNQKPIWSVLQTYLNEPINEMYCTLRADPDGYVMPTFVARQIPFSSAGMAVGLQGAVTGFIDLPRWVLHPALVEDEDLGQSDALKFNYVHLPAQDIADAGTSQYLSTNQNYVTNPPYVDTADIERSGLHMFSRVVGARVNETQYRVDSSPGRFWTRLMADIVMGQHLRFTGSVSSVGIQEPICAGDNLQYDGGIYHIERVTHTGSISDMGRKSFTTSLQLSNGISILTDTAEDNVYMVDDLGGIRHPDASTKQPAGTDAEEARVYIASTHDEGDH